MLVDTILFTKHDGPEDAMFSSGWADGCAYGTDVSLEDTRDTNHSRDPGSSLGWEECTSRVLGLVRQASSHRTQGCKPVWRPPTA